MAKERKKSEPKPIDVDAEVTKALLKIATTEGPMRFVKGPKGSHPAVYPKEDEKAKKVVEKCREAGNELVKVIGSENEELLELTPAGKLRVADAVVADGNKLPLEDRLKYFTDEAQRILIPAERYETVLSVILAEQAKQLAEQEERDRRTRIAKEEDERKLQAALKAIADWKAAEIAYHKRELVSLGAATEPQPAVVEKLVEPVLPKLPMPGNDEEKDFRRQYARRLVSAWYQAVTQGIKDGQRLLEDALYNMEGLHAIGDVGRQVAFDPFMHEPAHGAEVGANITITRCGWWLEEPKGRYILLRASAE